MINFCLSFFLLLLSIFACGRASLSVINKVIFAVLVIILSIADVIYIVADYFTGHGIDNAAVYQLKYGLEGAVFFDYAGIAVILSSLLILILFFLFYSLLKKKNKAPNKILNIYCLYFLLIAAFIINPGINDLYDMSFRASEPYGFSRHCAKPYIEKLGGDSKNLVFIYAEGLEGTYFNEEIFPGLIKGLRDLQSKSVSFSNIASLPYAGYTIGGLVGSQCAIPLVSYSPVNSMTGVDYFLPSAVCLSDLLKKEEYKLIYYGGADLSFAGKGIFLRTHKFDEVFGKKELYQILVHKPSDRFYFAGWGLYDDTLFDLAFKRFEELSRGENKFALFLLTLDTHHPMGRLSPSCKEIRYKDGSNPMLNAVACSDYLISQFVRKIIESPFAKNTIVVVLSDHLAHKNTAYNLLRKKERKYLFMIIDPEAGKPAEIKRLGSVFDVAPTISPFIGFKCSLCLGRDLLSPRTADSEISHIHDNLTGWEKDSLRFWNFPGIEGKVEIDANKNTLRMGSRVFSIPVLVEIDRNLETTFTFDPDFKGLARYLKKIKKNNYFMLVDKCSNIDKAAAEPDKEEGFCLVMGKGGKHFKRIKLKDNVILEEDYIRKIFGLSPSFKALRVAHAGGGISGCTYTNSIEALEHNIKNGFLYFELDFSFTADGQLVCSHSFDEIRKFGFRGRPTLEVFRSLVDKNLSYKLCAVDTLAAWMKKNPSAVIVTDVKDDNIKALRIISEKLPDYEKRVIPQIYYPEDYSKVKKMGYNQIIWTLYRYNGRDDDVLYWASKFDGPFAVTLPREKAFSNLPCRLAEYKIPVYAHTINKEEEFERLRDKYCVKEIYTDFLYPNNYYRQGY